MTDQTAQTVVDALLARWILLLGAQRRILSDQGANFESAQVQNLSALLRIEKVLNCIRPRVQWSVRATQSDHQTRIATRAPW